MLTAMLALSLNAAPVQAGELIVTTGGPAQIALDGQWMGQGVRGGATFTARDLEGTHRLDVYNPHGELVDSMRVEVPCSSQVQVSVRRGEAWVAAIEPMAPRRGQRGRRGYEAGYNWDPNPYQSANPYQTAGYGWGQPRRGERSHAERPSYGSYEHSYDSYEPVYLPEPMNASRFRSLLAAVDNEPFSDDQVDLIRSAARGQFFTVQQVGQLMDQITFSSYKVDMVRSIRDSIIDPENAWELNAHLTFSSDKSEVQGLFA